MITKQELHRDMSYNPYEWYGAKYYINQCFSKGETLIFIMELFFNEKNELCQKLYKKPILKNKINLDSYLKIKNDADYLYEIFWKNDIPTIMKHKNEKEMDDLYSLADHFNKVNRGG